MDRRKFISGLGAGLLSLLAGCGLKITGNSGKTEYNSSILVAYFSHTGNTRKIANQIHKKVGGDIFEILTVNSYPGDFDACLKQAIQEKSNDYRPQLKAEVENMDSYDKIFVGYPIWKGTMPMALFTFLEKYDFSPKTIIPFCTYDGSGLGQSVDDINKLCPQATILNGLAIQSKRIYFAQNDISAWLSETGLMNND